MRRDRLRQQQRQLDVLERGQHRDQVVGLEDEPDVVGAPAGDLGLGEVAQILAVDDDLALGRPVQPRDQVQERGLARSRRSHQGQVFTLGDLEVEVCQDGNHELIPAVLFVHTTQRRSTTVWPMNELPFASRRNRDGDTGVIRRS